MWAHFNKKKYNTQTGYYSKNLFILAKKAPVSCCILVGW